MVPKRISQAIINALKGGVVPRVGLGYITVGRQVEIDALLHDIDIVKDGGAAFRFIVGKFGSGKSFLLQTIKSYAMERDFVVVDADLSIDRRLVGTKGQGLATYKELIQNMSTKTRPDGGALPLILDKWINNIRTNVQLNENLKEDSIEFEKKVLEGIISAVNEAENMVHGYDFSRLINAYYKAFKENNDEQKNKIIKWFRGEYQTKTEAKNELGVNIIINDDDWYEYIKLFSCFLVNAGYKGMLILIDELVNIYKIPNSITRQYNYEKMLTMYNDVLQGKAKYIGIIMGGTPQCMEDQRRGVFSYEALKSRLSQGRFATDEMQDMLAPIIYLNPLSYEEMFVLIEKLALIHSELYSYESKITQEELLHFIKIEYSRIGANSNITPREVIRDFIEILNICYQNPEKTVISILGEDDFAFSKQELNDEKIEKEFEEFTL